MSTKQVLGYLWPIALLKRHGKAVPTGKKLQSISHQGKMVKGAILEEFAVGFWAWKNHIMKYGIRYEYDSMIHSDDTM